jgi:hypothetical protein
MKYNEMEMAPGLWQTNVRLKNKKRNEDQTSTNWVGGD